MRAVMVLGLALATAVAPSVLAADPVTAEATARRLRRFPWLADGGACHRVTWASATPACPRGMTRLHVVVDPEAAAPRLTRRRAPRARALCVRAPRASVLVTGLMRGDLNLNLTPHAIDLINGAESHVAELVRSRARREEYAAAQREALERGEPY